MLLAFLIDVENLWIKEIVAAVVGGLILLGLQALWGYGKYRSKKSKNKNLLAGIWNCYFYSNHNRNHQLKFISATLTIEKGNWREPEWVVYENREGDKDITYKGTMEEEKNCILIKMNSEDNTEFVLFRLYHSLHTEDTFIHGLQLSADVFRHPYCGALLLSRNKMDERQVVDFIKKYYSHRASEQMITTITEKKN